MSDERLLSGAANRYRPSGFQLRLEDVACSQMGVGGLNEAMMLSFPGALRVVHGSHHEHSGASPRPGISGEKLRCALAWLSPLGEDYLPERRCG